jgi:peroxiredoxin Q/BCP
MAAIVEEGTAAPDFTLPSDSGESVSLSQFRGSPVVLYFYSKDDTPGCTTQACGIRDVWGELQDRGAVVLGVSPDSPKRHVKFKEKHDLPFTLLSDEEHEVAEAYGTWVERVMRKVKPAEHADDVLAALP